MRHGTRPFRRQPSFARQAGRRRRAAWLALAIGWLAALPAGAATLANDTKSSGVLSAVIDPFLTEYDLSQGQIGLVFLDGKTGTVLYERGADLPLKPASNSKILTTAAALHFLGRGFRYRTLVAFRGERRGDTIHGDLVAVGSGDPSISGRFADGRDRTAIFREWADALLARGIRHVTGDVVGIDDAFEDEPLPAGWPLEDRGEWYCADVSALAFNENCIDLRWFGAREGGRAARFEMLPKTDYVRVANFVTTARDDGHYERFYSRVADDGTITVRGRLALGEEVIDSASVGNPTLYFATVLRDTLRRSGIQVDGVPRDADDCRDKAIFRGSLEPVTWHESPVLYRLIEVVNRNSHNFYAEQIFKTLGRLVAGKGTFEASAGVVRAYLAGQGIDCEGLRLVDGSGLSRDNRVTARQIAGVLRAVEETADQAIFRNTFPQGGRTGSLRKRFGSDEQLRRVGPRVLAKTGYLRGSHALSGWLETRSGRSICFSILCNDLPMTDARMKLFLERLVAMIADLE